MLAHHHSAPDNAQRRPASGDQPLMKFIDTSPLFNSSPVDHDCIAQVSERNLHKLESRICGRCNVAAVGSGGSDSATRTRRRLVICDTRKSAACAISANIEQKRRRRVRRTVNGNQQYRIKQDGLEVYIRRWTTREWMRKASDKTRIGTNSNGLRQRESRAHQAPEENKSAANFPERICPIGLMFDREPPRRATSRAAEKFYEDENGSYKPRNGQRGSFGANTQRKLIEKKLSQQRQQAIGAKKASRSLLCIGATFEIADCDELDTKVANSSSVDSAYPSSSSADGQRCEHSAPEDAQLQLSKWHPMVNHWVPLSSSRTGGSGRASRSCSLNSPSIRCASNGGAQNLSFSQTVESRPSGPVAIVAQHQRSRTKTSRNYLTIDAVRFFVERNLVAALISAYILISLVLIIVLTLPCLFRNDQTSAQTRDSASSIENGPVESLKQPMRGSEQKWSPDSSDASKSIQTEISETDGGKSGANGRPVSLGSAVSSFKPAPSEASSRLSESEKEKEQSLPRRLINWFSQTLGITRKRALPWSITYKRKCERMKVTFCSRTIKSMLPSLAAKEDKDYNYQLYYDTLLPNQFMRIDQEEIEQFLKSFEPLIDVRCYELMPLLLCAFYVPKCEETQNSTARLVPPCRSVCEDALRKCSFFLEVLSLDFIDLSECSSLPESENKSVCLGLQEHQAIQKMVANQSCREDAEFRCNHGECIPKEWRCDGFFDCADKSDEEKCSRCEVATQFYCGQDVCIDKRQVCDGRTDCKDGRDERLCLRLSNSSLISSGERANSLHRLEAWNASNTSWVPVCAANWRPEPMSEEACQALGYSRVNETMLLDDSTARSAPAQAPPACCKGSRTTNASETSALDSVSVADLGLSKAENGTEAVPAASDNDRQPIHLDSLSDLLYRSAQSGCSYAANTKPKMAVYLQCDNFQCGRSVTSHLSRIMSTQQPAVSASWLSDTGESVNRSSKFGQKNARGLQTIAKDDEESEEEESNKGQDTNDLHNVDGSSSLGAFFQFANEVGGSYAAAPEPRISSRMIVGGVESMPGEFPYLAALHGGPDEVFFCGGVLISPNWLLTAAHCVRRRTQPEGWMVKVGVTRRIASSAFVRKLRVRKIVKHPNFDQDFYLNNDIALILLDERVEFNQYLRPACLPPPNLKLGPDDSKDCVVVGFGKSKFGQDSSYMHVAHFVNVPIISQSTCLSWYEGENVSLSSGMLCAGYQEGKRDACQGDSGSGLFCRYPDTNQFYVAGVVSFGVKCGNPKLPGVYTSVPAYVKWIRQVTAELNLPIESNKIKALEAATLSALHHLPSIKPNASRVIVKWPHEQDATSSVAETSSSTSSSAKQADMAQSCTAESKRKKSTAAAVGSSATIAPQLNKTTATSWRSSSTPKTQRTPTKPSRRRQPSEFELIWANQVHTTPRPYDSKRDCGVRPMKGREGRVVGGRDSHLGEFPWSVLIRETSLLGFFVKTKCGGVLIDLKWVLTAAHCQPSMFGSLIVVLGEYDLGPVRLDRLQRPIIKKVKRMIIHRDYNPSNFDNDIALLELETPLRLQPHVVPICLPEKGDDFIGHQALVAGWGKLNFGGPVPSVLQVANLPVIGNKQCQEMYHASGHMKIISDSFLCAGYERGGQDSCEGDSGGPLQVQRAHDNRWVLVGTVSHGIKCAEPNLPGIYIRTAAYLPWIRAITYHQDHNKRYGPNVSS